MQPIFLSRSDSRTVIISEPHRVDEATAELMRRFLLISALFCGCSGLVGHELGDAASPSNEGSNPDPDSDAPNGPAAGDDHRDPASDPSSDPLDDPPPGAGDPGGPDASGLRVFGGDIELGTGTWDLGSASVNTPPLCGSLQIVNRGTEPVSLSDPSTWVDDDVQIRPRNPVTIPVGERTFFEVCIETSRSGEVSHELIVPELSDVVPLKATIRDPATWFGLSADGSLRVSENYGESWSEVSGMPQSLIGTPFLDVTLAHDRIVATYRSGMVATTDGESWSIFSDTQRFDSVAFGAERFVAVGQDRTWTSTDGETWQPVPSGARPLRHVVFGAGMFVGTEAKRVSWSVDGERWEFDWPAMCDDGDLSPVVFAGGLFHSRCDGRRWVSADGQAWTALPDEGPGRVVARLDGWWIASSEPGDREPSGGLWRSADAQSWERLATLSSPMVRIVSKAARPLSTDTSLGCTRLRCEDFETQPAGFPPVQGWSELAVESGAESSSSAVVDRSFAYSGSGSMRIDNPSGDRQGGQLIMTASELGMPGAALYGRMMVFLEQPLERVQFLEAKGFLREGPDRDGDASCDPPRVYDADCPPWEARTGTCTAASCERNDGIPQGSCVCGNRANYNVGQIGRAGRDEFNQPWANYFIDGFKADCWKDTTDPAFPVREWFCLSWEIDSDSQIARFYRDEEELIGLRFGLEEDGQGGLRSIEPRFSGCLNDREPVATIPYIDTLRLGANPVKTQPGSRIWVDDLIVDDAPVRCR